MAKNELVCPICGDPSRVYMGNARKDRLCGKHADMLKAGELVLDEKGKPIYPFQPEEIEEITDSELTCIICGKPSNGKHFCVSCYHKYKNKVVYIQVKKCKEFTKLQAEYESELVCSDGHMVKSPYEKLIDNWLYSEGIRHAYEKKIDIDETHDITPDFYIQELGGVKDIYVEFWGYGEENVQYTKTKEYKAKLYAQLVKERNIAVVYLSKAEVDNDTYQKKIRYAKQGEIKE